MPNSLLLNCNNRIWAALHFTILNIPPSRLPLFPSLAGSVWFLTLSSLLLTWIARGMKPYPGQSNPHVPFISDIASFELKPLFLVGASVTSMGFFFTVAAVHVMRYEPGFALTKPVDGTAAPPFPTPESEPDNSHESNINENNCINDGEKGKKLISLFSIFAAGLASTALTLLAVMDTFRYEFAHHIFLRICFLGLAVQSAGTAVVYWDEVWIVLSSMVCFWIRNEYDQYRTGYYSEGSGQSFRVRIFATLSTTLILLSLILGLAFLTLTVQIKNKNKNETEYRAAAILEWIIAFLGTIYLWLFIGFFDRESFDGYIPSVLYHYAVSSSSPDLVVSAHRNESSGSRNCGSVLDAECAPLLGGQEHVERKYT
ncbi:Frag1/DRAM/Sfk1 family-domain-containing protein [Aspergillus californicus]